MHLQQAEGGGEVVHLEHRLVRVPQRELGRRRHVERVVLARVVDVVRHSCEDECEHVERGAGDAAYLQITDGRFRIAD